MLKRGEEPHYLVRNPNKPAKVTRFKKRGIGYTRKDKKRSKKRRLMAKESRRKNRRK
jgi:hypothetical protein